MTWIMQTPVPREFMPPRACGCVLGAQLGRCCQEPPEQGKYSRQSGPIQPWHPDQFPLRTYSTAKPRIRVKAGRQVVA